MKRCNVGVSVLKVSSGITDSSVTTRPVRLLAIAFALIVLLAGGVVAFELQHPQDSYTKSVLSMSGDSSSGATLFSLNCAGCHGSDADGRVGPSLHGVSERRSDASLIEQVTSGKTLPMPQFQPEPKAMADLLSYLKTL